MEVRRYMDDYLTRISSVDDAVGEVVSTQKEGLFENTIIVYTADQGFYLVSMVNMTKGLYTRNL